MPCPACNSLPRPSRACLTSSVRACNSTPFLSQPQRTHPSQACRASHLRVRSNQIPTCRTCNSLLCLPNPRQNYSCRACHAKSKNAPDDCGMSHTIGPSCPPAQSGRKSGSIALLIQSLFHITITFPKCKQEFYSITNLLRTTAAASAESSWSLVRAPGESAARLALPLFLPVLAATPRGSRRLSPS